MAFCAKGHYYDDTAHGTCPICVGVKGAAPPTLYEGDEGPVPEGRRSGQLPPLKPPPRPPVAGRGGSGSQRIRPMPRPQPPVSIGPRTRLDDEDEAVERLMGFLVVVSSREDEEYRYIRLRKGPNRIGRFGSRAQIELRDREVSLEHALLICTNSASRIVDLDSSNGLSVNGERCEIALLNEGDRIGLGRTELTFVPFPYVADD